MDSQGALPTPGPRGPGRDRNPGLYVDGAPHREGSRHYVDRQACQPCCRIRLRFRRIALFAAKTELVGDAGKNPPKASPAPVAAEAASGLKETRCWLRKESLPRPLRVHDYAAGRARAMARRTSSQKRCRPTGWWSGRSSCEPGPARAATHDGQAPRQRAP